MSNIDPYLTGHAPQRFDRTTDRHSVLHIPEEDEPAWVPFIGGLIVGLAAIVGLLFWVTK